MRRKGNIRDMELKNLKKDSWYWNKWTFARYERFCDYNHHYNVVDTLEKGGLLQYKRRAGSVDYLFHTVVGSRYCLPSRCVVNDIESISSAALKFFMLFVNVKKKKSREHET